MESTDVVKYKWLYHGRIKKRGIFCVRSENDLLLTVHDCMLTQIQTIVNELKPMDSLGTWRKMKIYIFALLMQNFIELYELLMPC